jgi:hypothetical protein
VDDVDTGVITMAENDRNHARHIFALGSMVRLRSINSARSAPGGPYKVLAKLPAQEGARQYRVQGVSEPYQRILREDDLEPA